MIFNFFKSKPSLKEIIPDGFVDIHSHILPGIDDGAKNIEDSIDLLNKMKKLGFTKIITTPHIYPGLHDNNLNSISNSYNKIKELIPDKLDVSYASEYIIDSNFEDLIDKNELLTIKEKYVLIELNFINKPMNLEDIIFKLRLKNYIPIIAHPERYLYFIDGLENLKKYKKMGCLLQMNLLSATNYYGRNVTGFLKKLLNKGLIDLVGSDIHNVNHIKQFSKKLILTKEKEIISKVIRNTISTFK